MLAVLLFLPHISGKFVFIFVALIASLLPDIDTGFSFVGKFKANRIIQFFVRHRGIFHSFTFCIVVAFLLAVFIPVLALPFFLGYSLHLFADSFTIEGIKPFWPFKKLLFWKLRTGSLTETSLFVSFLIVDLLVFIFLFKSVF
jgi:inner membrane protein